MWLFPSVASGSSLPTNARHSFSNDDLCAAYEGAANAMRENTSRMVLISNLQGVSALVMSATEAFVPRIGIGECEGRHTGPTAPGRARAVGVDIGDVVVCGLSVAQRTDLPLPSAGG